MAENMDLKITITGQNDTQGAFDGADSALSDLQKLAMDVSKAFEDFAKIASSSMNSAAQSAKDMTAPLQEDSSVLESLVQSMGDVDRAAQSMGEMGASAGRDLQSSMESATQSIQSLADPLRVDQTELEALIQSMGDVDRAAQSMGEAGAMAGRQIQSGLQTAGSTASESAGEIDMVSKAMQQIEQTSYVTRTAMEEMFTSMQAGFKNESLAAMDAGQLTDSQLRNIMEAATGTRMQLVGGMDDSTHAVDQLGQALSAEMIGEQLKSVGETGIESFKKASEAAAEFEFNISRIGAVLTTSGKATNAQMQQMSDDALKIGSSSSFSANQVAEGMYTLARQGLDATTILGDGVNGAINIVNDLAQATDSDMTDTATVITDVVHEYGLSGSALREVANTMSGALHNSSESLDDFYQSMKQVGPVASAMHQNALDMSTALALLAQHGITGSAAGTALKNMLLGLSPRTKAAAADFAKLGISLKNGASNGFFDLQGNLRPLPDIINLLNEKFNGLSDAQKQAALSTVFTKYGLAGLNTIVGESRDKFKAFQDELKKDDAATIAAKKMDNLHGDLLKFNAGVQTMMKSFGDSINGMLRPLVQHASDAVKAITQLPKPIKEAGMAFLGIGSALMIAGGSVIAFAGGVKMLVPTLEMAGIGTEMLEGAAATLGGIFTGVLIPIAAVIAILAVLALGFKLAYDHIQPFRDAVNQAFPVIQKVISSTMTFISNLIHTVMTDISSFWESHQQQIMSTAQTVWNEIVSVLRSATSTLLSTIHSAVSAIYGWWQQYWPEIQTVFTVAWKVMLAFLTPTILSMTAAISAGIGFIKGAWQSGWAAVGSILKAAWDLITGVIRTAWGVISGIVSVALDLLTGHFRKAGSDFVSTISNAFSNITSLFSNLAQDAYNFGANFVHMIASGISGAVGAVTSAVSSVASKIAGFLAWHSPTKEGPGADSDKWAPNFMDMMAKGIHEHNPKIQAAVNQVALGIRTGITMPLSQSMVSHTAIPAASNANGGTVIQINVSGNITRNERELADIISKGLLDKVKMQGKI